MATISYSYAHSAMQLQSDNNTKNDDNNNNDLSKNYDEIE